MTIPKNDLPIHTLTLPSTGKEISYRPFRVKEEKILLLAAASKDTTEMRNAIKQIIENCVVDKIDVNKSPIFDIEYIMLNLRIRSVGNKIERQYLCSATNKEGEVCNTQFTIDWNLENLKINKKEDNDPKIWLTDTMGVKMKAPPFSITYAGKDMEGYDYVMMRNSIEHLFDKNKVYTEWEEQEIDNWLDDLTKDQFKKMTDYLEGLPSFLMNAQHKCEKCGFVHNIEVKDLPSFF